MAIRTGTATSMRAVSPIGPCADSESASFRASLGQGFPVLRNTLHGTCGVTSSRSSNVLGACQLESGLSLEQSKDQSSYSLTGRITPELMWTAFRNVKRNRGSAGASTRSAFNSHREKPRTRNLLALMRTSGRMGHTNPIPYDESTSTKAGAKPVPWASPLYGTALLRRWFANF